MIYELHVGTFTPEGTWAAAARQLPELAAAGITVLELMPVSEFPGRFGWGYDGVFPFAPTRLYGTPDDFRRFVDGAHAVGLGVILDVVYNHLGPDGCVLRQYAPEYFTDRYANEWGDALNFDGDGSGPVREFFVANAGYWIDEFHLDGLRFDATQQMFDASPDHVLAAAARAARAAARGRRVLLVAENEPQDTRLVRSPDQGGYGLDALWNDDFHHTGRVALTGRREAYYTDYLGRPQELISAAKRGFLYQGQHYSWQNQARGTPHARCHRPHSSPICRTTTRWPTRQAASGCTPSPRRGAGEPSLPCFCSARPRPCSSRGRSSRPPAPSSTSPITTPSSPNRSARAARSSSRSSAASRPPR